MISQEKASVLGSWPTKGQQKARPHIGVGTTDGLREPLLTYSICDSVWGPAFIKTNAYAPWPIWIYLNRDE
jgi:hypothetical protein